MILKDEMTKIKFNKFFSIVIVVLVLVFSYTIQAKVDEIAKIKQVLEEQKENWNKADIEKYMSAYWKSDSLLFIGKNGPKFGWQTTLDNYKKSYPNAAAMGKLKFTYLKVECTSSDDAFVIGKWELERKEGNLSGYFSLQLKKIDNQWKIVIDHTS
jgi:ketosteroid isomerase-like protein